MKFSYSILIRTVGTAGQKYQTLLNCIHQQTYSAEEVIIALPEGYSLPQERLGYERFIFTPKGMVSQRAYGIETVKSEYVLLLDDDLSFEPDFVEKLFSVIRSGQADASFPFLPELLPQKGLRTFIPAISGSAIPFRMKSDFLKILPTGGWLYNRHIEDSSTVFYAETGPGACLLVKIDDLKKIDLKEELWLEKSNYPLWEDQVLFYKLHLNHVKIAVVPVNNYIHLDAGSKSPDRRIKASYALWHNKTIFWHRFIYKERVGVVDKLLACGAFGYSNMCNLLMSFFLLLMGHSDIKGYIANLKGQKDAWNFIRSQKYITLNSVKILN